MRALAGGVIRLQHALTRHLPLDREVPLLILGVVVFRLGRAGTPAQESAGIAAHRVRQTQRPWVGKRRKLRAAAVQAPWNGGIGEAERRSDLAFDRVPRSRIENPVRRPNRGLAVQGIREAEPRLDVVPVTVVRRAAVGVGEPHQSLHIGIKRLQRRYIRQGRRRIEIEPIHPVKPVRPWNVKVVAEADVQGQAPADSPVVIDICPEIPGRLARRIVDRYRPAAAPTEQRRGQPVPLARARYQRILRSRTAAERETAVRQVRLEVVLMHQAVLGASLDGVSVQDLGQSAGCLVDILVAMDDRVSARAHRTVLGRILGERKNSGGVNRGRQPERGGIETHAERVANSLCAQHAQSAGDDRGRVLGPRIVHHKILRAAEAGVPVMGNVSRQVGYAAPAPVHAVP